MAQKKPRAKGNDSKKGKPRKKKVSPIVKEGIEYVDYKDVNLLRAFMSDRAKIRARRVTGNDVQQQRAAANAIKVAREMALMPYASKVVTQRKGDKRGRRGERPDRDDRPRDDRPRDDRPRDDRPRDDRPRDDRPRDSEDSAPKPPSDAGAAEASAAPEQVAAE